jgi:hypothetical protein
MCVFSLGIYLRFVDTQKRFNISDQRLGDVHYFSLSGWFPTHLYFTHSITLSFISLFPQNPSVRAVREQNLVKEVSFTKWRLNL